MLVNVTRDATKKFNGCIFQLLKSSRDNLVPGPVGAESRYEMTEHANSDLSNIYNLHHAQTRPRNLQCKVVVHRPIRHTVRLNVPGAEPGAVDDRSNIGISEH